MKASEPKVRRPMTDEEKAFAAELRGLCFAFPMPIQQYTFVKSMFTCAAADMHITDKQGSYLRDLAQKYEISLPRIPQFISPETTLQDCTKH